MNIEERRYLSARPQYSMRQGTALPKISGYAALFDSLSEELKLNGKLVREIVKPGAFAQSLASSDDVLARFDHDTILGRTSNGTLKLSEDRIGLHYEIDPPDTQAARDLIELIRRGDISSASFAFIARPGGESWRYADSRAIRELRDVQLLDVSVVTQPQYKGTSAKLWQAGQLGRMRARLEIAERV
jgi:HK97 family phage prohead protease